MSDRKLANAVQQLFRQVRKIYRGLSKGVITWLLRTALLMNRRGRRRAMAGFVLPTTIFLILVVALTAGAIAYRAFNSSSRTIAQLQNRVIYNAATPAVDRARAKLEYLFDSNKDTRYPGGVPSEEFLASMLLNNNVQVKGVNAGKLEVTGYPNRDPYTLTGETRIDINADGQVDNAWYYAADLNGDGDTTDPDDGVVAYSIVLSTPIDSTQAAGPNRLLTLRNYQKALGDGTNVQGIGRKMPFVRNGPLTNASSVACNLNNSGGTGASVEVGWYQDQTNTSVVSKRFQVDAFVVRNNAANAPRNFTTLEMMQDRQLNRGNKWGAWFRNDLEIFPGPQFNWNGAMHTEGSLFIGNNSFTAYPISAPNSCLFYPAASEITVTKEVEDPVTKIKFNGAVVAGRINNNSYQGSSQIYLNTQTPTAVTLGSNTDWVGGQGISPYDVSSNPEVIVTRDGYESRNSNVAQRGNPVPTIVTPNTNFRDRIRANAEQAPYVDDLYRADNRYGPKLRYDRSEQGTIPSGKKLGDPILQSDIGFEKLTKDTPAEGATTANVGLDGYWERRARIEGLRILVGQRLELGNMNGWVAPQDRPNGNTPQNPAVTTIATGDGDFNDLRNFSSGTASQPISADSNFSDNEGDPLYPPYSTLTHEAKQRRSLRDNLSAVQSTAIYHAAVNRDFPVACMASVVHPGSPSTIRDSLNFVPTFFKVGNTAEDTALLTDFFTGRGTNGWEFETPGVDETTFANRLGNTQPLGIALRNLANFAGDPDGAFPPLQEANKVHPDPYVTMWGNYSNLRRALQVVGDNGAGYTNLSPAEKTYLQTAACTLGMLAYNIDQVQKFDPRNFRNDVVRAGQGTPVVENLAVTLFGLMNGDVTDGEVLPKEKLATYSYASNTATADLTRYNARDYDQVPAEAYIGKLKEKIVSEGGSVNDPRIRLAEVMFAHFQVRRDRTYGFRPSPAANTWNYNPYVAIVNGKHTLWSSACDPNVFGYNLFGQQSRNTSFDPTSNAFNQAGIALPNTGNDITRLALSRLCGTIIPPAGVRDYPGDLNYPQRGETTAAFTQYLPKTDNTSATLVDPGYLEAPTFPGTRDPVNSNNPGATQASNNWRGIGDYRANAIKQGTYNGSIPYYQRAQVAPKFPSLYYLFPEFEHDLDGAPEIKNGICVDHRQPTGALRELNAACGEGTTDFLAAFQPWAEPYITQAATLVGTYTFKPVDQGLGTDAAPAIPAYPNPVELRYQDPNSAQAVKINYFAYETFAVPERPVGGVLLRPRKLPGGFSNPLALSNNETWKLPVFDLATYSTSAQNTPPNRILVPNGTNAIGRLAVIPFLDHAMYEGREWMMTRVMDMDIGMMRRTQPQDQVASLTETAPNDAWLPVSGIIYAFREDSVREDGISRPAGTQKLTNATSPTFSLQTDPAKVTELGVSGLSIKAVDFVPDPERRAYGFRIRNGTQLKRHTSLTTVPEKENFRGMSFFSDDPLFIMGNYNLHQTGAEDEGDPNDPNRRLEELTPRLPDSRPYTESEFFNRPNSDPDFARSERDRWRPSELLADSVGVLSDNFCDGSIFDSFITAGSSGPNLTTTTDPTTTFDTNRNTVGVYRSFAGNPGGAAVYNNPNNDANNPLYTPGCVNNGRTSYLNQNRPSQSLQASERWARENQFNMLTPIRVSRNGAPMQMAPVPGNPSGGFNLGDAVQRRKPYAYYEYSGAYYGTNNDRPLQDAQNTRVNTIMISGIVPSRVNQSYGGLHNFPRFLERWNRLWFAGSFLQLNFSNYATGPYDQDAWEPTDNVAADERISYYSPPERLWGYDTALQFAPPGPASSRFVTLSKERNEFYNEPSADDPYIVNLCRGVRSNVAGLTNLNCPAPNQTSQ